MIFLKKVYQTNRIDFFFICFLLFLYAGLHYKQVSVLPLHLFAMYSEKMKNEVTSGQTHKVFINGKPLELTAYNSRKRDAFLRMLDVYTILDRNEGVLQSKVYKAFHQKLPFLAQEKLEQELYIHPNYKVEMKAWLREYTNCKDCNVEIYLYTLSLQNDLSVTVQDSIQIL